MIQLDIVFYTWLRVYGISQNKEINFKKKKISSGYEYNIYLTGSV